MTHGLLQAGIDVIAGIDLDRKCKETYEYNNSPARFIQADLEILTPAALENGVEVGENETKTTIKVKKDDDNLIFVGCSPCQFWSIMNTDKTKSRQSKNLLIDFQNFIAYFNPGFVIIENVPGIFSKADSPLKDFIEFLNKNNYKYIDKKIIRVCDYGVPQRRRRFVLVASRIRPVSLPKAIKDDTLTVKNFIGNKKDFPEIPAGYKDTSVSCHTTSSLSETNLKRINKTSKNGGTRADWQNTELQLNVYKKNENVKGFGFSDIYGRMFWDKPAPTITTRFYSLSNGRFGHPEQNRAISLREGATLQTFPLTYVFKADAITDISRMIGNAVPPELSKRIGDAIINSNQWHISEQKQGQLTF